MTAHDEPEVEVAARLWRHPRFVWREGMRDQRGIRVFDVELFDGAAAPDLGDPATVGVLLGWLGELGVLSDVVRQDEAWIVAIDQPGQGLQGWLGDTMGEAAAFALLAAWEDGPPAD